MPENKVGDGVHIFFGQGNLSHDQHHPHIVDGNWPGLNNTLPGSQIQINASASFNRDFKNYNLHQPVLNHSTSADSERIHGGESLDIPRGLNLMQSAFRSELGSIHTQSQQQVLGGHMYGHQVFQTRQGEMNCLGAESESKKHNLMSRGLSMLEAQVGNDSNNYNNNLMRFNTTDSPANCNFVGGQQQLSGQHSGILQSLSRPQSGASDMQLLQQQAMFKQMQELQRQQLQRQQQQENVNQFTAIETQAMGNHSTLINGIPVHSTADFSWPPEMVAANNSWLQRGASPVMQGPSTGHMMPHQHNQALQLMGVIPQQVDNSFYGVPVSSTDNLSQYSHLQGACDNSFSGNQYIAPEQVGKQDSTSSFRQELQGKSMFGHAAGLMRNSENDLMNAQQQESSSMQESHERHDFARVQLTSQEKSPVPAAPSQNVATLDPTEEKILFGSDDSMWDVFGRNAGTGMVGTNTSDGTDFAFPSLSSGTWSALMQSAVAETSSGDAPLQEQWSGLSLHNTEQQTGNLQTSGGPQTVCPDGSLHNASSLNPMPSLFSGNAGTSTSYGSIYRDVTPGRDSRLYQSENLQADSSQRSMQQFSADVTQQEGPKQGNNVYANVSDFSGILSNVKSTSGSLTYQSGASSYNKNDQQSNGQNGWNFIDSLSPAGGANSKGHRNETDRDTHVKMGEGGNYPKMSCPPVERELGGSTVGGLQLNKEDPKVDSASAIANLNSMKANPENSQQILHGRNLAFWNHVNPSVSSRGSTLSKNTQPNTDSHPYGFAQAGHQGLEKEAAGRHEIDDSNNKENSSDSFCSNASQQTSGGAGGRRENVWLNAGDSHNLLGSREKASNQVGQRPPGVRKFHYHPMGDVDTDVEPSHGCKQNISARSMHQQVSRGFKGPEPGNLGQSTFASHIADCSVEADKDRVPAFGGQPKGLHVDPSKCMVPVYEQDAVGSADGSSGNFSNRTAAPSKNVLELFHEADKQREPDSSRNFSSSNCYPSSEMPGVENSDGVGYNQQNRSSVSQHFGLQLGPPSQRLLIKDQPFSKSPVQQENPFNSTHMSSGTHLQANRALSNNIQGNNSAAFNSGFHYPVNYLQHQAFANSTGQSTAHQSPDLSFNGSSSQLQQADASRERNRNLELASVGNVSQSGLNNDDSPSVQTFEPNSSNKSHTGDPSQEFPLLEAMPICQTSKVAGMFQKGRLVDSSPKIQYNGPSQEQSLGGQAIDFPNSHTQPKNYLERTFPGVQKPDGQHAQGNYLCDSVASKSQGVCEAQSMTANMQQQLRTEGRPSPDSLGALQGRASIVNYLPDASPSNIATSQRDIEAFGRSLGPNNISQNLSLLHLMQSTRKAEADPLTRSVKRLRGPEFEPVASRGGQPIFGHTTTVKDATINHPPAFTRGNPSQISPQMAPSWFDQYGTLGNGQIMPVHGAKSSMAQKAIDPPFIRGGSSQSSLASSSLDKVNYAADANQPDNIQQSVNPELLVCEKFSTPVTMPQANNVSLALRTRKRKSGTFEMIPWSKEVMQCSRGLQNSSMSEVEWAQATNRLTEKMGDVTDMIEDSTPIRRSKRRLVLTTQLLQQLLHPPPASVISEYATTHYENQVYYISRLALGDTCSSISFRRDSLLSLYSRTMPSLKCKESERFGEDFSDVTEDFIGRAKKLEEDLLKLEKGVSVLDLRLECQDLEKFSVINRFAKFHSRSQADGVETPSSSDANSQKPSPQRYIAAVPMPRNIPDRVPCLLL